MNSVHVIALTFGLGCAAAAETPAPDKKQEALSKALESFTGTWEVVTAIPEGATKGARRLVFRKDWSYSAQDEEGKELWAGTFNLDPAANPKIWDHRSKEAVQKGGDALGIYDLNGDALKVCCVVGVWKDGHWTGKPRPTEFALPAADVVLELRRMKPER